jgi:hypothetical protein
MPTNMGHLCRWQKAYVATFLSVHPKTSVAWLSREAALGDGGRMAFKKKKATPK